MEPTGRPAAHNSFTVYRVDVCLNRILYSLYRLYMHMSPAATLWVGDDIQLRSSSGREQQLIAFTIVPQLCRFFMVYGCYSVGILILCWRCFQRANMCSSPLNDRASQSVSEPASQRATHVYLWVSNRIDSTRLN